MSLLKDTYYNLCSLLPMPFLKSVGASTTLLPYHHTVSSQRLPHISNLYNYKNENAFISDLDFLLKHFKAVSVNDLEASVQKTGKLPARSFLLSFDDGFREVYDVIAPILEKKGVPAIFFINPAFIDNKELFYRCKISLLIEVLHTNKASIELQNFFAEVLHSKDNTTESISQKMKLVNQNNTALLDVLAEKAELSFTDFLITQQPFLTSPQLLSLHERGFTIGAHSMHHPYYQLLPLTEQVNETIDSCNFVNNTFKTGKSCFSFPHSDVGLKQELFDQLKKHDIPFYFGIQNQKEEISNKVLHRFNAERPETDVDTLVKGLLFMMWVRRFTGANNVTRKN